MIYIYFYLNIFISGMYFGYRLQKDADLDVGDIAMQIILLFFAIPMFIFEIIKKRLTKTPTE